MSTIRSIGFEAASQRIRLGLTDERGARSYRELRGAALERARAWVDGRVAWLAAREPGIALRSLRLQLDDARALITLEAPPGESPRAITLEGSSYDDFASGALAEVERWLSDAS